MNQRIRKDKQEFIEILRGKLRGDLLKFLEKGHFTIKGPKRGIAIPIEAIDIPRLKFYRPPAPCSQEEVNGEEDVLGDPQEDIGVGQGDGKPGDLLGPVGKQNGGKKGKKGEGERQAGQGRGSDIIEVEFAYQDFFELFKEVLELPRIKPKGEKAVKVVESKYTDIRRVGPDSLIHKRRTLKEALKRAITEGTYDPKRPRVFPIRADKRFRAHQEIIKPKNNAVLFFMMDVSGSMGDDDRAVVRYFCALCEFWLSGNYDGLEIVWIVHNGEANEVPKEEFFATQRAGGTVISSAHELMLKIIAERYPPARWNIYPMYFSDGFNFGEDDRKCLELIKDKILPVANQYTYGEVSAGHYWWDVRSLNKEKEEDNKFSPTGSFGRMLEEEFLSNDLVVCTNLKKKEDVPGAIKEVFKQGN